MTIATSHDPEADQIAVRLRGARGTNNRQVDVPTTKPLQGRGHTVDVHRRGILYRDKFERYHLDLR